MKGTFEKGTGDVLIRVSRSDRNYLQVAKALARQRMGIKTAVVEAKESVKRAVNISTKGPYGYQGTVQIHTNPSLKDHEDVLKKESEVSGTNGKYLGKGIMDTKGNLHTWQADRTPGKYKIHNHEDVAAALGIPNGEWAALHFHHDPETGMYGHGIIKGYANRPHWRTLAHHISKLPYLVQGMHGNIDPKTMLEAKLPPKARRLYALPDSMDGSKPTLKWKQGKRSGYWEDESGNFAIKHVYDIADVNENGDTAHHLQLIHLPSESLVHDRRSHYEDDKLIDEDSYTQGYYGNERPAKGRSSSGKKKSIDFDSYDYGREIAAKHKPHVDYLQGLAQHIVNNTPYEGSIDEDNHVGDYEDSLNQKKGVQEARQNLLEAGFTGIITAKNGVKYHYVNGKRVASGHQDFHLTHAGPQIAHPHDLDDAQADALAGGIKQMSHSIAAVLLAHPNGLSVGQVAGIMDPTKKSASTGKFYNTLQAMVKAGLVVKQGSNYVLSSHIQQTPPPGQAPTPTAAIPVPQVSPVKAPAPAASANNPYKSGTIGAQLWDIVKANPGLKALDIIGKTGHTGQFKGKFYNALGSMVKKNHLIKKANGGYEVGDGKTPTASQLTGTPTPAPASAPTQAKSNSTKPEIPHKDETVFVTGKPQDASLNGIDFSPAPPKFWEKVKDVDIKEPPSQRRIDRAGVMIIEPDGRIWIVQPTNEFGNRKHTLPGGGVEAGLSVQQNALKEVWEETGLQVEITGFAGDFRDSNNGNNGRLYIGRRIGGAPWDAKVENHIIDRKTGKPAAESSSVSLVTPEKAAQLLHRTDDLAQLAITHKMPVDTPTKGKGSEVLKKALEAIQPAVQHYKEEKRKKGMSAGNAELHAVQELRGFNKPPKNVSQNEFDAMMAKGDHIEMLRGLKSHGSHTGSDLADQFRKGEHYPGFGCFGSGTYADSNKIGSRNRAAEYAGMKYYSSSTGEIIRMAIPKSAKIIKQSELEQKVKDHPDLFPGYRYQGGHAAHMDWWGVQAALAGYDAIEVDGKSQHHGSYGKGFYVILNRSIVTVQDKGVPRSYTIK